jgi:hypothetical protein
MVLTIFSCCDYCEMGNEAGVALVSEDGIPNCETIKMLLPWQTSRRRVVFPSWIIEVDLHPIVGIKECHNTLIEV